MDARALDLDEREAALTAATKTISGAAWKVAQLNSEQAREQLLAEVETAIERNLPRGAKGGRASPRRFCYAGARIGAGSHGLSSWFGDQ